MELALAPGDRGLGRGGGELGLGGQLSDLRIAAGLLVVELDQDGVAFGLDLDDDPGPLGVALLAARRGNRASGDRDRVAVDRDDQSRYSRHHDDRRDDDADDPGAQKGYDGRDQRLITSFGGIQRFHLG